MVPRTTDAPVHAAASLLSLADSTAAISLLATCPSSMTCLTSESVPLHGHGGDGTILLALNQYHAAVIPATKANVAKTMLAHFIPVSSDKFLMQDALVIFVLRHADAPCR
jgi:hypothetical protein